MTIKKFQGKTKEEAIASAKADMGPGVVIMNVKELRPKGLLGIFKSSQYEVTAAIEDDAVVPQPFTMERPEQQAVRRSNFNAVADEEIPLPTLGQADTLKDAFAAVNQVIEETKAEKTIPPKKDITPRVEQDNSGKADSFLPLESKVFR